MIKNLIIENNLEDGCPFKGSRNSCGALSSDINKCPTCDDDGNISVPSDCPLLSGSVNVVHKSILGEKS